MGLAIIEYRQILLSKHMLKFGTGTTFLLPRDLQKSENQIHSWIRDKSRKEALKNVLDTGDFGFPCLPFLFLDGTRCKRMKGTGSESSLMH